MFVIALQHDSLVDLARGVQFVTAEIQNAEGVLCQMGLAETTDVAALKFYEASAKFAVVPEGETPKTWLAVDAGNYVEPEPVDRENKPLGLMDKDELLAYAAELGIEGVLEGMTKPAILAQIQAAEQARRIEAQEAHNMKDRAKRVKPPAEKAPKEDAPEGRGTGDPPKDGDPTGHGDGVYKDGVATVVGAGGSSAGTGPSEPSEPSEPSGSGDPDPATNIDLDSMKVPELLAFAESQGIDVKKSWPKPKILDTIKNADVGAPSG